MRTQLSTGIPSNLYDDYLYIFPDRDVKAIFAYILIKTNRGIYRPNDALWKKSLAVTMNKFTFLQKVQEVSDYIVVLSNGNWLIRDFMRLTHKDGICIGKKPCKYCQGALSLYASNKVNFATDLALDNIRDIDIPSYILGEIVFLNGNILSPNVKGTKKGSKERLQIPIAYQEPISIEYTDTDTASCRMIVDFLADDAADWNYIFTKCKVNELEGKKALLQDFADYVIGTDQQGISNPKKYILKWAEKWHEDNAVRSNSSNGKNRDYSKNALTINPRRPLPEGRPRPVTN